MEILLVHGIDPYITKPGGTRSYILNLINFLITRDVKVSLAGISYKEHSSNDYDFIRISNTSDISSMKFLFMLFVKSAFLRISKDCIIVTNRSDNMLPFHIFHRNNPKVCVLHGVDAKKIKIRKGKMIGMVYDIIERFSLKFSDVIIAVDTRTSDFYINRYPWIKSKIKIIHVGINLKNFKPLNKNKCRLKYSFSEKDNIVMYVGRLEREKNIEFIMSSLKSVSHDYKFVVVGDGNYKDDLKSFALSLNINCFFMGTIPHVQLPEILNCANLLVISSLFESGPLVVQEAIACGVPVVSTDVGRVKEFIKDDDVGVVCNRNINEFAKAIDKMLDKDAEHLIEYRRTIAKDFGFEDTGLRTLEIFKALFLKKEGN